MPPLTWNCSKPDPTALRSRSWLSLSRGPLCPGHPLQQILWLKCSESAKQFTETAEEVKGGMERSKFREGAEHRKQSDRRWLLRGSLSAWGVCTVTTPFSISNIPLAYKHKQSKFYTVKKYPLRSDPSFYLLSFLCFLPNLRKIVPTCLAPPLPSIHHCHQFHPFMALELLPKSTRQNSELLKLLQFNPHLLNTHTWYIAVVLKFLVSRHR